jgi:uncharacterized protein YtpQ (UPF0354 family)
MEETMMKWWMWAIIFIVLLQYVFSLVNRSWKAMIRKEIITYIREKHPEIEIVSEKKKAIVVKFGDEQAEGLLGKIYDSCAKSRSPEARQAIYEEYITALKDGPKNNETISLETHGSKIMPRLITQKSLEKLCRVDEIPNRPFACTDLLIVYVLDYQQSVVYISAKQLMQMGIHEDQLYEIAIANIEKTFPAQAIKNVLEKQTLSAIKMMDSYDAARILALPKFLPEGVEVVALIPDKDILAVTTVPVDGDWNKLKKLARTPSGKPLCENPLIVSRNGFRVIQ